MVVQDHPNVVLICADQWRGDCLSIDGHATIRTPFLDQLALRGARFTRAYSPTPTCIPARASLYTGLDPRTHGRVGYRDGVPWTYDTYLAQEFTDHGYQTQAVGKLHVYPPRFQAGFQNVILHDGYLHYRRSGATAPDLVDDYLPWLRQQLGRDATDVDHGLNANSIVARPWSEPEHTHATNYVVTQSIDFLRRRDTTKPFFLFMSFHHPHPPLVPPSWALEQYLDESMPLPPVGDWVEEFEEYASPNQPDLTVGRVEPQVLQRARAGYYGLATHIDHQINRFLETFRDFGGLDNTYICFVSDHGEMLGDHNMFRKSVPYEGSCHVPLILAGPENSGINKGSTIDGVVGLQDIMPTLLDCARLPVPDGLDGRSLLPQARGNGASIREFLHGEHAYEQQSIQWLTDGMQKYVWFSGTGHEQLFDLTNDRQELHNLSNHADWRARLSQWRSRLIETLAESEEGYSDGKQLIPGRTPILVLSHVGRR